MVDAPCTTAACLPDEGGCSTSVVLDCCGNDIEEDGEGCDDGNTDADDGCSPTCTVEPTGEEGWLEISSFGAGHANVVFLTCGPDAALRLRYFPLQ